MNAVESTEIARGKEKHENKYADDLDEITEKRTISINFNV